jgi:hypothetical protein
MSILKNSEEGGEVMKSRKPIKSIIGFVCVMLSISIIGCYVKVPLSHFDPVFTGDYSAYKGKRVFLMNFSNRAQNTGIHEYYSGNRKFVYSSGDHLGNYFWYAFRDAFTKLGMVVSDMDAPDLTAPGMWLALLSITDVKYDVNLTVQKKDKTVFINRYTIYDPPFAEKDRNPAVLEQRAYRMMNRLIETILKDPGFQKVLTEP